MKALLQALADLGHLATDPALPRAAKVALGVVAVYVATPIDLIPDFIPFLGYLDDVLIAAVVVDGILNYVDRALVLRYWPGTAQSLQRVARTAAVLAAWVPRGLKKRIFSVG